MLAVDDDRARSRRARRGSTRRRIAAVALVTADATVMRATADADAVLLDAPCSGLGILGRQPEARWRKHPDDPARMAALQARLLRPRRAACKPGGALVYAVCSTDRREGEDVVDAFLAAHAGVRARADPARYAPFATPAGDVLVAPGIDGRDGFFVARLNAARAADAVNVFARIERACARIVEDAFARVFPSALDPAQIGRRLVATAQAEPSDMYLVRVHPSDYARLAADRDFLEGRWTAMLREALPAGRARGAGRARRRSRRRRGLARDRSGRRRARAAARARAPRRHVGSPSSTG